MHAHPSKPARLLAITTAVVAVLALASGVALAVHLANQQGIGPFDRTHVGLYAIPATRPGQVPAFTEADVRDFFTPPLYVGGSSTQVWTTDGTAPRIQSITFMSRARAQAYTMLHDSLNGLPADALVCVVVVNGPLILVHVGPAGPGNLTFPGNEGLLIFPGTPLPTPTPTLVTESVAYMVFDASTGNLIAYGV
jgi:hypothetical protein